MGTQETKSDRTTNRAQQPPEFLVVGRVIKPHGIRGALVVEPLSKFITDILKDKLIYLGPDYEAFRVLQFSPHRKRYLLSLETLTTRNDAEMYRDAQVCLRFEDSKPLPAGEYYDWQLLGMTVITDENETLGILEEIIETGANDVYLVRTAAGKEILLPAIESVIKTVDLEHNQLRVHMIPGLLPGR
jgi:16S rRNA processing protein RimM